MNVKKLMFLLSYVFAFVVLSSPKTVFDQAGVAKNVAMQDIEHGPNW